MNKTLYTKIPTSYSLAKLIKRLRICLTIGIFSGMIAAPACADISLTFGTYADEKPSDTVRRYKSFLNYLAAELTVRLGEPVKIKMKIAKEYDESIQDLAEGNVDFARFGPASYITVHAQNPKIEIVAIESKKGAKRFKGIIAVHNSNMFASLSDLKGHSFAFGDQLSTIGRYLAQSHLIDAGIKGADLSNYEFLGRHDRVGTAVGAGSFTAGALKDSTFKKLVASGEPIKALFEFENVTKPWLSSETMDARTLAAMREIMLEAKDADVLEDINKDGFLSGDDADYDFIRKAMKHSQMF